MTQTDTENTSKTCSKCKKVLPVTEFHKDSYNKSGLACQCKECTRARAKAYAETAHGKQVMKNYKIKHPEVQKKARDKYIQKDRAAWNARSEKFTKEDFKRWRQNHLKRISEPGTYVLCELNENGVKRRVKAEVMGEVSGMVKVRILSTGKHILSFKSHIYLGRQRGQPNQLFSL